MRLLVFLLLFLLVFAGVAAYDLQTRGLLTREAFDRFLESRAMEKEEKLLVVEPVGLAASVRDRRLELKEEEEGLQQLTARLESQRKELETQRALIERRLEELKAKSRVRPEPEPEPEQPALSKEMALLVKIYENMPPEDAAAVFDNLPDSTVAQMLLQMRGRQAAQIMGALNTDKAAEISKLLSAEDGVKKLPKPETAETAR